MILPLPLHAVHLSLQCSMHCTQNMLPIDYMELALPTPPVSLHPMCSSSERKPLEQLCWLWFRSQMLWQKLTDCNLNTKLLYQMWHTTGNRVTAKLVLGECPWNTCVGSGLVHKYYTRVEVSN
jgi:hypothetical protein